MWNISILSISRIFRWFWKHLLRLLAAFFSTLSPPCLHNVLNYVWIRECRSNSGSAAQILNLSKNYIQYFLFYFSSSVLLPREKSPKVSVGWTLLPVKPLGSIYHICKLTQAGSGLHGQYLWDQKWWGTMRSHHVLSHGIFLFEQWLPSADGRAHRKVICVMQREGARKRSSTCHCLTGIL